MAAVWLLAAAGVAGAQDGDSRPRHPVRRAVSEVTVDGRVVEPAWSAALTLGLDYEVQPGENVPPPVRTEMFLTFNDTHVLLAFKCYDPDPSQIRARYSDRDTVWNDDWVGVVLDTFNDERRAYELFVNARGVQMDAINDDMAGSYDQAWDAIWTSAGRVTSEGYEVEMAIPFNQLRFQDADGPQTWGIDGVRSYPRVQRHHIGMFPRSRGENSYLSQEEKIEGFEGVAPGRNLEFLPTVTAVRTDRRPDPPSGPLEHERSAGDLGLTTTWGITANLTANLTVNPDFSQVEADAAQLDVNEQFALFFPETRPFFLEGTDYFNLRRMNLVYTRTVADPVGAIKTTGKSGRHTYGVFSARDAQTNVLVPGSQGSQTARFALDTTASVGRYRMDFGRNSAVGVTMTDRQGGGYHNQVFAVDTTHRFTGSDAVSLTVARSATQYNADMQARFGQRDDELSDGAVELQYTRTTRNWFAATGFADYGAAFRADLGFVTQVDYRKWEGQVVRFWHGGGDRWFNQLGLGGSADYSEQSDGVLLERGVSASVSYSGARETFGFANVDRRDRVFAGVRFQQWGVVANFGARPSADVSLNTRVRWGDEIDFAHARAGTEFNLRPSATINIGEHWLVEYAHIYNRLDLPAGRLFTANIAEPRLVYQFNTRAFLRAILQFTDVRRSPALHAFVVDTESRDLFTQLLFSYTVNPQTVLYLGYSDTYIGADHFRLIQRDRTFFMKASYAWLL